MAHTRQLTQPVTEAALRLQAAQPQVRLETKTDGEAQTESVGNVGMSGDVACVALSSLVAYTLYRDGRGTCAASTAGFNHCAALAPCQDAGNGGVRMACGPQLRAYAGRPQLCEHAGGGQVGSRGAHASEV